jgi:gamma-glutamylcyclotransferase (GGCT)/AIG2-like uncharacterized protein YtfP
MDKISLAVNGSLMRGLALNQNLLDAQAQFIREARTSPNYRLWSIGDSYPAMMRDDGQGAEIDLEIWEIPLKGLVDVLKKEPPGLCMGKIELEDGEWVFGVLGENYICKDRLEITRWGGWRKFKNK